MKLIDIQKEWEQDCKIDRTAIDEEAAKVPYLHGKYWKIRINEKIILKKKIQNSALLKKNKIEYYSGRFSKEDYKDTGWEQFDLKLLKQDIPIYLDSDEHICQLNIEIEHQEEKCKFIEDIIKSLNNRSFLFNSVMDFIKFANGIS